MPTRLTTEREAGECLYAASHPLRPLVAIPYTLIACFNQDRQLLMVKRTKPPFVGCWNFIGGKIEAGETAAAAAIREIREEAGRNTAPRNLSFRGIAAWPDPSDLDKYVGMFLFFLRCKTSILYRNLRSSQRSRISN
jgi:8-oxo-dGTP pyrophosphatase MutT (NUDIX family)